MDGPGWDGKQGGANVNVIDHGSMNRSLTWTAPRLMNTLILQDQFLLEPLFSQLERGAIKIKSCVIFYVLVSPTFL